MAVDFQFTVVTGREARPMIGTDSTLLTMNPAFYVDVQGERTLNLRPFMRFLREFSDAAAANLGEVLHHAAYTITREPAVVQSWGELHDCDVCRTGVRDALRVLATTESEIVVGQLWWAGE